LIRPSQIRNETAKQKRVVVQFEGGTRILLVIHGRDARVTWAN
jgi:hypothetical protein